MREDSLNLAKPGCMQREFTNQKNFNSKPATRLVERKTGSKRRQPPGYFGRSVKVRRVIEALTFSGAASKFSVYAFMGVKFMVLRAGFLICRGRSTINFKPINFKL